MAINNLFFNLLIAVTVLKNICKHNTINITIRHALNTKKVAMTIGTIFVLVLWGKLFQRQLPLLKYIPVFVEVLISRVFPSVNTIPAHRF